MKFTDLSRPFIIGVISDNDAAHCIRSIKKSEFAGADGFQLELHNLQSSPPTKRELKDIIGSTIKPVWTTNRRSKADRQLRRKVDEHARIQVELTALDAGAQCIDLEMDTFDPWYLWDSDRREVEWSQLRDIPVNSDDFPGECCFNEDAIREQKKIIDHVHNVGGEVLLSCQVNLQNLDEPFSPCLVQHGLSVNMICALADFIIDL
jgi:arsenate reductase-like glutaredoxin family protein